MYSDDFLNAFATQLTSPHHVSFFALETSLDGHLCSVFAARHFFAIF